MKWFQSSLRVVCSAFLFVFVCASINAATLPTGFFETRVEGLPSPTAMEIAPDGRVFVCLQFGELRVVKNGVLLPTPFLTVNTDPAGERGLLGVAFDPNFATNNFVYIYYTSVTQSPRFNRVSRFTANGDVAVPGSEQVIIDLDPLSAGNHNGGAIHFGPDGKLYIATGENAVTDNSQTLSNVLGKILRINPDGSIPGDNPFFNVATGKNRSIWALGLRNPFTFAFQPGTTRMFINDVGAGTWEEINDGIAGSNYGWPVTEGPTSDPRFRSPIFAYPHGLSGTTGCAIAGGTFYNPQTIQFPTSFVGKYFFADLCSGWIRVLDPSNNTAAGFATGINQPVDLKVGADGSLYYVSIGASSLFKVQFDTGAPPTITSHPSNQSVLVGQPASFSVVATGSETLTYQWQKNMVNIGGATAPTYDLLAAALIDNGAKFRCLVTNSFGTTTSNEATLTVSSPPPIIITEENTDVAIALDSVIWIRDPFFFTNPLNFSSDQRTRLMFFVRNLDLLPSENMSAIAARAEDAQLNQFPLTLEFVGRMASFDFIQVVGRLPDNLPTGQILFVSLTLRGQTSNKARIRMR
ncbi:MAG TPA: PQQ-dependent sugar dehydrogenase [Pyrinomonadaceae bacterium]|nr:PQQ-dependent sugar dehydrogenase [Pyrinomonadaceae bacterium]